MRWLLGLLWPDAVWFKEATNLFRRAGALKWNLFNSLSEKASIDFFYEVSLFTFKYSPLPRIQWNYSQSTRFRSLANHAFQTPFTGRRPYLIHVDEIAPLDWLTLAISAPSRVLIHGPALHQMLNQALVFVAHIGDRDAPRSDPHSLLCLRARSWCGGRRWAPSRRGWMR